VSDRAKTTIGGSKKNSNDYSSLINEYEKFSLNGESGKKRSELHKSIQLSSIEAYKKML
jgi:hypothetical protein